MHNYFDFLIEWLEDEDIATSSLSYLIVREEFFNI